MDTCCHDKEGSKKRIGWSSPAGARRVHGGGHAGWLYRQDHISMVTLESGKIMAYREYWDPYVALRDFGLVRPGIAAR